jgi:hypothetical protein
MLNEWSSSQNLYRTAKKVHPLHDIKFSLSNMYSIEIDICDSTPITVVDLYVKHK